MTLEQLRVFVMVAKTLNMREAAEKLYLTQPAVSSAIAALENRYGTKLFDRVGRGLELNEVGRLFLPEAQNVLATAKEASRLFDDLSGLLRGDLCVAASQTVATYYLPRYMARFASAHPGLSLRLMVGNTAQAIARVISGEADMGVIEGHVDESSLAIETIKGDSFGFYVAPTHFLAGCVPRRRDLLKAQWVLREAGSGTRDYVADSLKAQFGLTLSDLTIRLGLPSNDAVLEAVMEGELMTAETDLAATLRLQAGLIQRLDYDLGTRNYYIIRHRERRVSHAVQKFSALIRER
ncbi:LysR substrate-binding domain-containing protein [Acetobacteraceae bacterium ESL0709]|nr:LysR substrate-binding domain-containing protein [Acetobacteraceae bacterium ESL0697]MDF7677447.1 LysR substrate-binding domain-containing protein [Acetobacteraceae bacterium ESL0709]